PRRVVGDAAIFAERVNPLAAAEPGNVVRDALDRAVGINEVDAGVVECAGRVIFEKLSRRLLPGLGVVAIGHRLIRRPAFDLPVIGAAVAGEDQTCDHSEMPATPTEMRTHWVLRFREDRSIQLTRWETTGEPGFPVSGRRIG